MAKGNNAVFACHKNIRTRDIFLDYIPLGTRCFGKSEVYVYEVSQ